MCSKPTARCGSTASAGPRVRTLLFPVSDATLLDTWRTIGLCGTASDSYWRRWALDRLLDTRKWIAIAGSLVIISILAPLAWPLVPRSRHRVTVSGLSCLSRHNS
jgi:hypothetical protein